MGRNGRNRDWRGAALESQAREGEEDGGKPKGCGVWVESTKVGEVGVDVSGGTQVIEGGRRKGCWKVRKEAKGR